MRINGRHIIYAQDFLLERFNIANLPNATIADESYFKGCISMLQALGIEVIKEGNSFRLVRGE